MHLFTAGVVAGVAVLSQGQTVNTTSGQVSGHTASNTDGVEEYLGVPFAQPPLVRVLFLISQTYMD